MAQALPIPAGQPLGAARTAAGQVVTLAGAEALACGGSAPSGVSGASGVSLVSRVPKCEGPRAPIPGLRPLKFALMWVPHPFRSSIAERVGKHKITRSEN